MEPEFWIRAVWFLPPVPPESPRPVLRRQQLEHPRPSRPGRLPVSRRRVPEFRRAWLPLPVPEWFPLPAVLHQLPQHLLRVSCQPELQP